MIEHVFVLFVNVESFEELILAFDIVLHIFFKVWLSMISSSAIVGWGTLRLFLAGVYRIIGFELFWWHLQINLPLKDDIRIEFCIVTDLSWV